MFEFTEHGYEVDVASPIGTDAYSDPRDESGYSAEDLIGLGFVNSPAHMKLVDDSKPLGAVRVDDYDAALLVGGQGPMYTFFDDDRVHQLVGSFYEAGKVTAVICHMRAAQGAARGRPPARRWQDVDRLRQLEERRGRLRRAGRSSRSGSRTRRPSSRTPTSSCPGGQAARRARRQPDHGPAAVLGRLAARMMVEALGT